MKKKFHYLKKCRCCNTNKIKKIIDLGKHPLANNLKKTKNQKENLYPLELNYCEVCFNCQLSICVDSSELFDNYLYLSSVSNTLKFHFEAATNKYIKLFNLKKESFIIDVGSNDGIGILPFQKKGYNNLLAIEPAKNLAKITKSQGIETINDYLNKKTLKKIKRKADLILASNVFAHSNNLKEMAKNMLSLLSENGTLVIEVQYFIKTLKDLTFDNIYHEHYNYWTLTSLQSFFTNLNTKIYRAEKINTHGGSLRIYVAKNIHKKIEKKTINLINSEKNFGVKKIGTYKKFASKVYLIRENVLKNINQIEKKYGKIVFFGSPAKASTALNFYGISSQAKFIIEDNKLKQNKFLPGVNIPICSRKIVKKPLKIIIVLAWNFFDEIKRKNSSLGKKFLSIKDLEKKNFI